MAKFNNIIKWIFLIGFSTTLVMQVAGDDDDKTIVEKVNKTLVLIEADFKELANKIHGPNVTTYAPESTTNKPVTSTGTTVTTPKQPETTTNNPAKTTKSASTTKTPTKTTKSASSTKTPTKTTKSTSSTKTPTKTSKSTSSTKTSTKTTKSSSSTKTSTKTSKSASSTVKTQALRDRKKRDVLSQIWEMKMRKMQNKLALVAEPADVTKLKTAMKNVTAVTDEIADGTIKQDQVTRVEDAEKDIKDVVNADNADVLSYLKTYPDILEGLQKDAAAASKTVKKYYDDHFEDDGGANVGAIVGGVCGGVAGVGLLGFGYYYYKKKQS